MHENLMNLRAAIVLLLLPFYSYAQTSLSGVVTDAGTKLPLPGVSVYIPELKTGVNTAADGTYNLSVLQDGQVVVQFSFMGYETFFTTVRFGEDNHVLDVALHTSQMELKEVKVMGTQNSSPKETPFTIDAISIKEIRENGSLSISDAVAKLPGVSQLTTGAGISKPVIRGLYGNRVQVNVMGLRFDNQQWQDEHGLGLSDMGIDRVEIIKGPATLMYGSDALGGVLNVVEEKPAPLNTTKQNFNLKLLTNTFGIGADYGIKKTDEKKWWRLRLGAESNGDYSSSGNKRVLNSRFANYNLKASVGFKKGISTSVNNAYVSFSQFGFVFDSLDRKELDSRISRTFDGPHHTVFFGVLSSENTFYLGRTKMNLNGGYICNLRQEQEGGSKISLNMLLNTFSLLYQTVTSVGRYGEWINGISLMGQLNSNYGSRTIIPDAFTFEDGWFSLYKWKFKKAVIETGIRYDTRYIKTSFTETINGPGSEIQPFSKNLNIFNGSAGLAWNPLEYLNIKAHVSTGYRSGNLAELSANGLHEGTSRWEIGNPNLKAEQNICSELGFAYELGEQVELNVTGYYNRFFNYIYLAPTGTEYFGFNIYRYMQTNATLAGGEASLDIHPAFAKWMDAKVSYAHLDARRDNGMWLPFIPANKVNGDLRFLFGGKKKFSNGFIKAGCNYVFAQNRPAEFETSTQAYFLLNAGLGGNLNFAKQTLNISLVCTNLTDAAYVDHLSRFKYYGINNMGRNIVLNLGLQF